MGERLGNVDPLIVPHRAYLATGGEAGEEDAWVFIAAEDDAQWTALARAMGHPEWSERPHPWSTVTERLAAREEIDAAVAEFALTGTAEEIAERVAEAGALAAPVVVTWSLLTNPQLRARDWIRYVDHK